MYICIHMYIYIHMYICIHNCITVIIACVVHLVNTSDTHTQ